MCGKGRITKSVIKRMTGLFLDGEEPDGESQNINHSPCTQRSVGYGVMEAGMLYSGIGQVVKDLRPPGSGSGMHFNQVIR